jgi:precorrin-6A/cobalt-precorrin-6A reductase
VPTTGPRPLRRTPPHVLVLGGTTEARRLAEELSGTPWRVTTSLAGRVAAPGPLPGTVRVGGFGGTEGLAAWLRAHEVTALVDATHPFAATMSFHAAAAAAATGVPLLALRRPGWTRTPGDDWHDAASLGEAASLLPSLGSRVFLTTGRTGLAAFTGHPPLWFLVRAVDPPTQPLPARAEVLLDRGPFSLEGERALLARHRIDVLVTKDSGGAATAPKLTAAREAGIPVVMVRRPAVPEGVPRAGTPAAARAWLAALAP